MGDETTQTTPISKAEYKRFKQFVQDTHGTTRGHLRTEIENALREYRQPDEAAEPMVRVEDDIAQIKAMLADSQADGGTVASTPENSDVRTHADTGKPNPNAPRMEKIEWIIGKYCDNQQVKRELITSKVKEHFGFQDRTAEDYADQILERVEAEKHPKHGDFYLWGEALEQAKEEYEKELREELSDE